MKLDWINGPSAKLNGSVKQAAEYRQTQLTKPPGALGALEQVAIQLAAMQGRDRPSVNNVWISLFAGDHGIAEEGVSAFPQAVTREMVRNFARGGAAISVIARELSASLEVTNLGTIEPLEVDNVVSLNLGPGTANFAREPAMSHEQCARALAAGRQSAERAKLAKMDLFIGGEMGIGNTTAATAMACCLLNLKPKQLAGPGTGLDARGIVHKIEVIERALELHQHALTNPYEILRHFGGFEIAALTGAYIACGKMGVPVLIDGYISTAAALAAERMCPDTRDWYLYGHGSAEPGHKFLLEALGARPLLDLGMRLGEGSGAAVAVPLLRLACALHNDMATFADAGVSNKSA